MSATSAESVHIEFEATIAGGDGPTAWFTVTVPDSGEIFGTRKPIKVQSVVEGHPFTATLLPQGDGTHMLPLRAAVRQAIGKGAGDRVQVRLERHLT